jgi:hypothetical protein
VKDISARRFTAVAGYFCFGTWGFISPALAALRRVTFVLAKVTKTIFPGLHRLRRFPVRLRKNPRSPNSQLLLRFLLVS